MPHQQSLLGTFSVSVSRKSLEELLTGERFLHNALSSFPCAFLLYML